MSATTSSTKSLFFTSGSGILQYKQVKVPAHLAQIFSDREFELSNAGDDGAIVSEGADAEVADDDIE